MVFKITNFKTLFNKSYNKNDLIFYINGYFDLDGEVKYLNNKCFDVIKEYNLDDTTITVTKRNIGNNDFFLYFDIANPKNQKIIFRFKRLLSIFPLNKILSMYDFENYFKKPEYDHRYGENKVSGPYSYLDLKKGSIIISKMYYFKEMRCSYDNDQYSSILELEEENCNITTDNDSITMNISPISKNCSFFILVSNKKLFKELKTLKNYFNEYFIGILNNNVINSYFLRHDGTYTKLPYSIEPFTREGYGFSLHHSSKKELIPYLNQTKDRYFYDFIVNSIMQSFIYQKNDQGIFYTNYTSTWLKKDTGITAPYIDTRLNETFNLMLKDFKCVCPDFDIEDNTQKYCDFLIKQFQLNNIYCINKGIFFPDYFKDDSKINAHASLNHQLGIINLMLSIYQKTKDEKYFEIARKMLLFIDNTFNLWIKPNKDLYYGIKLKNDIIELFGNDYVYVTLIDLLILQKTLVKNNISKNKNLDYLIQSKIEYLNSSGFSIFDSNAKLAPGEPVLSRKKALKLYEEYLKL